MKKAVRITVAFIVLAVTLVCLPISPAPQVRAEDSLQDLYAQLAELIKEQNAANDAIADAQEDIDVERVKMAELSREIYLLEEKINVYNDIIADLDAEITTIQAELNKNEADLETYYDIYYERARTNYEQGQTTYLDVLFGSGSFTDYLTRIDVVEQIMAYDNNLIALMNDTIDKITAQKAELVAKRAENETARVELAAEQAEYESVYNESQALVARLGNTIAAYEAQDEAAEKAKDEINAKIDELVNAESGFVGGEFMWPVPGCTYITSHFGYRTDPFSGATRFHGAVDIGCRRGTELHAANGGIVIAVGYDYSGGYYISIDHGGGMSTRYFHLSAQYVTTGQTVGKGEVIGLTGNSGAATTGAHLHFEVRVKDANGVTERVDPLLYVTPY